MKKPALRFNGYVGNWNGMPFDKEMTFLSNNTLSRADLNNTAGEVQNVHYGDVLIKFGEVLDLTKEALPFINAGHDFSKLSSSMLKDGDIVIADTAEDETAGKCTEIWNAKNHKVLAGLHTMPCRPNTDYATGYLGYYMNSPAYHNQLLKYMQGTKVISISKSALKSTVLSFPKDKTEQTAIGLFFNKLNSLIEGKRLKLDKLKKLKQAYLGKMFPKKGSRVPEVRFKGFSDEWIQYSFKDITYRAGEKNKENRLLDSYSISNERGFVLQDEQFENGGTMRNADKSMYIIVSPESFAYNPARINIGSIGYQNVGRDVIVSSLYEVFKTTNQCYDRFLWHWFKSPFFTKLVEVFQEGGVRLYFYYDKLCMCNILLPSVDEQKKIAAVFDNLDTLIALQQKELDKLANIKSACLSKMFA